VGGRQKLAVRIALLAAACAAGVASAAAQTTQKLMLRGHEQVLHLYGPETGDPVVVSSGDGGWIHLAPHVAETLAAKGSFVVGFDVKTYLAGFTFGQTTVRAEDEPGDYRQLADFAARATHKRPILIGVSEGAGLSVLAAADPQMKQAVAGVIGVGLPDLNELGWRWKDAVIWLTHGVPNEPTFSTAAVVERMAPIPLAALHSTHDEFVPLDEARRILDRAREPKRLWIVPASSHSFGDNRREFDLRLFEAIAWVHEHAPAGE
jgi:fermentation-respiration switch protein FrsA (DUF1100 family)